MEVINLSDTPTVSFGPGIELLMNDKPKKESVSFTDLDKLESELNDLSKVSAPPSTPVPPSNNFPRTENIVEE